MGPGTLRTVATRFAGTTAVLTAFAAAWLVPTVVLDDTVPGIGTAGPGTGAPQWTARMARSFPRCTDRVTWTRRHPGPAADSHGALPTGVIVVGRDGTPHRTTVPAVEDAARTPRAGDDVLVVGWCS